MSVLVILLAICLQVAGVPLPKKPDPAVNMDMVDTPLVDLLNAYASSAGLQLDISELPGEMLAKPITIAYIGDVDGFLAQLRAQTDLQFFTVNSGGAAVLTVTPKRAVPYQAIL